MHVKRVTIQDFKRFTDLTVEDIPSTACLVVLTGQNGSGKSAILEAFQYKRRISHWGTSDPTYFNKAKPDGAATNGLVDIEFHEGPVNGADWKRAIWVRSAYRHEADFDNQGIQRQGSTIEEPGAAKLIDGDKLVATNYGRLASSSIEHLYDPANRDKTAGAITDDIIGPLQSAMAHVFEDLTLNNLVDPMSQGTFFFNKNRARDFAFKNLSSGERAAFDLLLDMLVRRNSYDNTVFCIDEPELHLSTKVQAKLLDQLLELLPAGCQLWIATHSPGMMKRALSLHRDAPDDIAFLDTYGHDFDQTAVIKPIQPSREFWRRSLEVALDDMATLVAPDTLVLCEGNSAADGFDATCYRTIFGSAMPDVEFVSVGNSIEVQRDSQGVGAAIQVVAPGTKVIRLIDRDDLSEDEISRLRTNGVRVLSARNIEGYLLDDELIRALYEQEGRVTDADAAIAKKGELLAAAQARGKAADDLKSISNEFRVWLASSLALTGRGSNSYEFLRNMFVPLVTPSTMVYRNLESDIFDEGHD